MMEFLSAYLPELNSDEQVWNHAKADVVKRTILSKDDKEKTIMSAMRVIQGEAA